MTKEDIMAFLEERLIDLAEKCKEIEKEDGTRNIAYAYEYGAYQEVESILQSIKE